MGKCNSKIGCGPSLKNQEDAVSRSMALKGLQRQPTTDKETKEEFKIRSSGYRKEKQEENEEEEEEEKKIINQDKSECIVKKDEKASCFPLCRRHQRRHRITSTSVVSRSPSLACAEQSQADREEKKDSSLYKKEENETLQDGRQDQTDQNHQTLLTETDEACQSEGQGNQEGLKQEEVKAERLHEIEQRLRKEAEEKLQREMEERLRKEAEEKLQREMEERLRKEAEEKLQREMEERLTRDAEEKKSKTLLGHTLEEKYPENTHWKYETPIQSYRPSLDDTNNSLCIMNRTSEEKQSRQNVRTGLSPSHGMDHRESSSVILVEGLGNTEMMAEPPMCGLCKIFGIVF